MGIISFGRRELLLITFWIIEQIFFNQMRIIGVFIRVEKWRIMGIQVIRQIIGLRVDESII